MKITKVGRLIEKLADMSATAERSSLYILHHYKPDDTKARAFIGQYLVEGGRTFDLGQGRAVMFHRGHVPNSQDHLHFLLKGKKLYALNRDGTAHDASHGLQMHRWAMDAVQTRYPEFKIPPRGLIESMLLERNLLVEARFSNELIPPNLLIAAVNKASMLSG